MFLHREIKHMNIFIFAQGRLYPQNLGSRSPINYKLYFIGYNFPPICNPL